LLNDNDAGDNDNNNSELYFFCVLNILEIEFSNQICYLFTYLRNSQEAQYKVRTSSEMNKNKKLVPIKATSKQTTLAAEAYSAEGQILLQKANIEHSKFSGMQSRTSKTKSF
jgi:hypothetical protein